MNNLLIPYFAAMIGNPDMMCKFDAPRCKQTGRSMRTDPQDKTIEIDSYGKKYQRDARGTLRRLK